MKSLNLMKKIDLFLFNKIDGLQDKPEFQKLVDSYSALEESYQDLIKGAMAIVLFVIPVLILFIFSFINNDAKNELKMKEEIFSYANELIQKKNQIDRTGNKILGRTFIDSQGVLQQKITNQINMLGVDTAKINVSNFEVADLNGNIVETKLDIKFTDLSNEQIFSTLSSLVNKERMKIENFSVKKDNSSNLLNGVFTVLYYSKSKEQ